MKTILNVSLAFTFVLLCACTPKRPPESTDLSPEIDKPLDGDDPEIIEWRTADAAPVIREDGAFVYPPSISPPILNEEHVEVLLGLPEELEIPLLAQRYPKFFRETEAVGVKLQAGPTGVWAVSTDPVSQLVRKYSRRRSTDAKIAALSHDVPIALLMVEHHNQRIRDVGFGAIHFLARELTRKELNENPNNIGVTIAKEIFVPKLHLVPAHDGNLGSRTHIREFCVGWFGKALEIDDFMVHMDEFIEDADEYEPSVISDRLKLRVIQIGQARKWPRNRLIPYMEQVNPEGEYANARAQYLKTEGSE